MTRGWALPFFALWACAACTLLNSSEQRSPERRPCDGGSCEPDPCAECDPLAECTNGGCRCPLGYLDPLGDGTRCEPEPPPPCRSAADCGAHAQCETRGGAAECRCERGYALEGGRCQNIDECDGEHDCDEHARCVDEPGDYSCVCAQGYRGDGHECEDEDECAADPCGAHATCANVAGSYDCSCEPGFAGDARNGCTDSDECANGELVCGERASCEPRQGPDGCACKPYYSDAAGDGLQCEDDRIGWHLWSPFPLAVSVAPATTSGGDENEELFAIVIAFKTVISLCGRQFMSGPGTSFALAVAHVDGTCRWARQLDANAFGSIVDLTVDAEGAVALSLVLGPGGATVDGQMVGSGTERSEQVLRFAADDGSLVWALPLPCHTTLVTSPRVAEHLASSETGDVYALLRYDGVCTIGGYALPDATGDNVAVIKLARENGAALWARPIVHEPNKPVMLNGLVVAADRTVYVAGLTNGDADFGDGTRLARAGFVLALEPDGALRWLQATAANPLRIAASGAAGRLRIMTFSIIDKNENVFDLRELDTSDGQERWSKRLVRDGFFNLGLSSDALGRTIFATSVFDYGTIGGEALPSTPRGYWGSLIALDSEGEVTWSHGLVAGDSSLRSVELTPSGQLFVTGYCPGDCDLGDGVSSKAAAYFALRMRM